MGLWSHHGTNSWVGSTGTREGDSMKFGFSLSNNQGIEDVQSIIRLAMRAEALGFDSSGPAITSSTWVTCTSVSAIDHITTP